jgi:hypothetical protein
MGEKNPFKLVGCAPIPLEYIELLSDTVYDIGVRHRGLNFSA